MKGIFGITVLAIFSICYSAKLKSKCECATIFAPCDLSKYCCDDLVCSDYRCSLKGTEKNKLAWAPDGIKCDWFHHCRKGFKCTYNRCIPDVGAVVDAFTK